MDGRVALRATPPPTAQKAAPYLVTDFRPFMDALETWELLQEEDAPSEPHMRADACTTTRVQVITRPKILASRTTHPANLMPPPAPKKRKSPSRNPAPDQWSFHPMPLTIDEVLRKGAIWAPLQHSRFKRNSHNPLG